MAAEARALRIAVAGSAGVVKTPFATALAERPRLPLVEEKPEPLVATGRRVLPRGRADPRAPLGLPHECASALRLTACPPPEAPAVREAFWRRRVESERPLSSFGDDDCREEGEDRVLVIVGEVVAVRAKLLAVHAEPQRVARAEQPSPGAAS